jgi:hypothetical protein
MRDGRFDPFQRFRRVAAILRAADIGSSPYRTPVSMLLSSTLMVAGETPS